MLVNAEFMLVHIWFRSWFFTSMLTVSRSQVTTIEHKHVKYRHSWTQQVGEYAHCPFPHILPLDSIGWLCSVLRCLLPYPSWCSSLFFLNFTEHEVFQESTYHRADRLYFSLLEFTNGVYSLSLSFCLNDYSFLVDFANSSSYVLTVGTSWDFVCDSLLYWLLFLPTSSISLSFNYHFSVGDLNLF